MSGILLGSVASFGCLLGLGFGYLIGRLYERRHQEAIHEA